MQVYALSNVITGNCGQHAQRPSGQRANGSATGGGIHFAVLTANQTLTNADFVEI